MSPPTSPSHHAGPVSLVLAPEEAIVRAGVPSINKALYRELRFSPPPHDPVILIEMASTSAATARPSKPWSNHRIAIVRDVELPRARKPHDQGGVRADEVFCYQDFTPTGPGLSGDREVASAQSLAECLRRRGVRRVRADRTLPLLYAHELRESGIEVTCEPSLGQAERRQKDAQEIEHLAHAQRVTEDAIRMACELIARSTAGPDGVLIETGTSPSRPLTSERVKSLIDLFLMERGFTSDGHIVAGGPIGADCHHSGTGALRTGEPIIVDVFPRDMRTLYHGDCTRMVVHGPASRIPEPVLAMHKAVVDAKAAAIAVIRAGANAERVHRAAIDVIQSRGFGVDASSVETRGGMPHGTGHGLGLDLKEPPLLDFKGPDLVVGDAVTVEPGVYIAGVGGMRIEDLVIVTESGCRNLNRLQEGLTWA